MLRGRPAQVTGRFLVANPADLCLCTIVVAELLTGAQKSGNPSLENAKVVEFCSRFPIIEFGLDEARVYASIRTNLESSGQKVGANDLIIGATDLARNLVLVTHNTGEFRRIDGLRCEDWEK